MDNFRTKGNTGPLPPPSPLPIFYKFDLDPLGGRRTKIKPNKNFGFFLSRPKVAKINVKNQKSVKKRDIGLRFNSEISLRTAKKMELKKIEKENSIFLPCGFCAN